MALVSTGLCALFLIAVPVIVCVCALLSVGTRLRGDIAQAQAPGCKRAKREACLPVQDTKS